MEYTPLGKTGLRVSRLAFGCEQLGGYDWGRVDQGEAMTAVGRALDVGINFFDTADVYGLGMSEEMLANALGARRHDVVIATKFGINWQETRDGGRARTFRDASPKHVVEALEASLRRLRLESIPLYQLHWPDSSTPISDTMEALHRCQEQGKILHIGLANVTPEVLKEAMQVHRVEALQVPYNLGERLAEEETLQYCAWLEIGVLAYGPLAQGLLSGKYDQKARFDIDDRRRRLAHFQGGERDRYLQIVHRVQEVASRYGKSPAQVALRWVLDNRFISCAIVGIKTPSQVAENIGAAGWRLSADDYCYLGKQLPRGA